jgi:hypothetical protein
VIPTVFENKQMAGNQLLALSFWLDQENAEIV